MELQLLLNAIKNIVEDDVKVDHQVMQKGNRNLTGITIGNGNIIPIVYMEDFEELFNEKVQKVYNEIAREMIETCNNANKNIYTEEIVTWEYAKNNILLCIAPYGTNIGYITIPYLDLELYFRVSVRNGSYKIKKQMIDTWGVTVGELLEVALKTSDYTTSSMLNVISELLGESDIPDYIVEDIKNDPNENRIIVTNKQKLFGASAIYKTEIFFKIADTYQSDLYIIPSSIHELIVMPICEQFTVEDMNSMIKEINEEKVEPEEILSDHVYIYRRNSMKIEW